VRVAVVTVVVVVVLVVVVFVMKVLVVVVTTVVVVVVCWPRAMRGNKRLVSTRAKKSGRHAFILIIPCSSSTSL